MILIGWLNEEHARGNIALRLFTTEFNALVAKKLAGPDWQQSAGGLMTHCAASFEARAQARAGTSGA